MIVAIGYERNLAALLQSSGGAGLVTKKVSKLVVMGGGYTGQADGTLGSPEENNFNGDIAAAQYVAANWPTTIVYSGAEVGDAVETGAGISASHPHYSPVRAAYEAFVGENNWIYSHDLTAMYEAIRPNTLLKENGPGTNVVSDRHDPSTGWDYGANVFTPAKSGRHYYLTMPDATALDNMINSLINYTPASTGATGPTNTALPTIEGTAWQGQTLTASPGSWSGNPTAFAYHWVDCSPSGTCTPIPQAIHQAYVVSQSKIAIGDTIKVQVWASVPGATSAMAQSAPTAPVRPSDGAPPVNTAPPTISGAAQEGQTLTAAVGTWTNSPTGYAYQWQRCTSGGCSAIAGATLQNYTLTNSDVGQTISVQVTPSNAGGVGAAATSVQTSAVLSAPPSTSGAPSISGTAQEGQTLIESHASWSGSPSSYG